MLESIFTGMWLIMSSSSIWGWGVAAAVATIVIHGIAYRRFAIFSATFIGLAAWLGAAFIMPPASLMLGETWFVAIIILVGIAVLGTMTARHGEGSILPGSLVALAVVGWGGFYMATSLSPFGHDEAYANVATVQDHGNTEQVLDLIDETQAPQVTYQLAQRRGAELMGEAGRIGSVSTVGEMWGNVISEEARAYWIAPLEHRRFRNWAANRETAGYVQVNMTNGQIAQIVQDHPINFGADGFYFHTNIYNIAYLDGYVNYIYANAFFQIDDEGVPHWVLPLMQPQVGMEASWPVAWLLFNATTGEYVEVTDPAEMPAWVDRMYPQSTVVARFDDWACFQNGWSNCWFAQENVIEATDGVVVTIENDGDMIYYTGAQFARQDGAATSAASGKVIVNARTGEVELWRTGGITEDTAKAVLQEAVALYDGWVVQDPVLINTLGRETLYSVIVGGNGNRTGFGFVDRETREAFGWGRTLSEAHRAYQASLNDTAAAIGLSGNLQLDTVEVTGVLAVVAPHTEDGQTSYFIRMEGSQTVYLITGVENIGTVATSLPGETVTIEVYETPSGQGEREGLSFENQGVITQ